MEETIQGALKVQSSLLPQGRAAEWNDCTLCDAKQQCMWSCPEQNQGLSNKDLSWKNQLNLAQGYTQCCCHMWFVLCICTAMKKLF